nr:uncharacterized protein C8orf48 homolog [Castor canadensis]
MAQLSDEKLVTELSDEKLVTDEVPSSSSLGPSGGQQSCSYDFESKVQSEKTTASSEEGDEQSELSDFKSNENKLITKWINELEGKGTNSGPDLPDSKIQTETTPLSDEELNALQSFCTVKVNLIHQRAGSKLKKSSRRKKLQFRVDAEASEGDALNYSVPEELLNRIYFKNTKATLKQMATAKQHISSQCPHCNSKRAELAQSAFLKQKKTLLESFLLREKIDEHLHTTDFLTRVGEAHQGLPRLSDDPKIIWKRLNEKTQIQYSGFDRSHTK